MSNNKKNKLSSKQRKQAIQIAQNEWGNADDINVDENPKLSPSFEEDGTLIGVWVQAWVFVHDEELK